MPATHSRSALQGPLRLTALVLAGIAIATTTHAATPPMIAISQVPLTVSVPAHPQVLFAVGNSESMDGNLSGAIMAGSGSLGSSVSLLQNSSSPTCFTTVSGFTPPLSGDGAGGCLTGTALYTVSSGSNLVDNSPSRLNVAKAGIASVLQTYLPTADFALEDYSLGSPTLYTTWLYVMSPSGGFTFTNTQIAGNSYVLNPCLNYKTLSTSNSVYTDCSSMDTGGSSPIKGLGLNTNKYMQISNSSDDPSINDVLYATSGIDPVCLVYGTVSPANPYTGFTLAQYNGNGVTETYASQINNCARQTSPTNAGFVPFTPQTMYQQRGFGYGASQSATTGNMVVTMQTAAAGGAAPTQTSVNASLSLFTPYLNPETNSTGTTEIKASGGQAPTAGLMAGALSYYQTKNPAGNNGCTPTRYVVLVTDGLPTLDLNSKTWPPLGSQAATGYGVTASFNSNGSLNTTNDQALTDAIAKITALNTAGIKVYVIGLGAGVDATKNPTAAATLTAMAVAGGTNNFFPATSPTALVSDLQQILTIILGTSQSVATAAVNSTGLNTSTFVYQAQFSTQDTYQDWDGNLSAFSINSTTGVVSTSAIWAAQGLLDSLAASGKRVIATWQPATSSGIPFTWLTGNSASSSTSGITPSSALGTALISTSIIPVAPDASGLDRLNYLIGSTALEQRNGGTFRNRSHILGDIVDSSPLYIGQPAGSYASATYNTFRKNNASRRPVLYVGAGDGMLHAFDASSPLSTTAANAGAELFAFIPNGVFNNLPMLTSPFYNAQHHFFVDGSPQASDVQFADSSWHTVLVSGEGAGGSTVFALDVTDPVSIASDGTADTLAQKALWEFTDGDMGFSYSSPAITSIAASPGYAVFFGNGYNSPNGKAVLYAVNPQTGALLSSSSKLDLCTMVSGVCNSNLPNGLSSVTAVNSSGSLAAAADVVYAGDLQGNLWRVNISNSNPSSWTVSVLFQARDSSNNVQPITVPPAVSLNPLFPQKLGTMVFFGTGQFLAVSDLSSTQVQSIYGVYDPGAGSTYTRSNLVSQTLSTATATTSTGTQTVLTVSGNAVNLNTVKGWYIDLTIQTGMRNVTAPRIEPGGALVLTTYTPNTSQCTGGGSSYLLVLNFATGGAFPTPEFILPGNTTLDTTDQVGGKNPVGLSLGNVFAAAPTIISANGPPNNNALKILSLSNGQFLTVFDRGGNLQRTSWWELQ